MLAFDRISPEPIRNRAEITQPDIVVVLDARLMEVVDVTAGMQEGCLLVVNTQQSPTELSKRFNDRFRVATIDANKIARETLGVPIVNTTMIGALLKASAVLSPQALNEPLKYRFGKLAEKNINAMNRAYKETNLKG